MQAVAVDLPMPRSRMFGMKRTTDTAHRCIKRAENHVWQMPRLTTPYEFMRLPSLQLIPVAYRNKARHRNNDLLFSLNDIESIITEIRDKVASETVVEFERILHARITEYEAKSREYLLSLLNEEGKPASYIQ